MDIFLNPPFVENYVEYFKIIINLSGIFLGLGFTALFFVIQNGFQSFDYSRNMFLEYYVKFGRNLFITLGYLILITIFTLYFKEFYIIRSILYYLFSILFLKSYLDFYKQVGYMKTIHSEKFVPSSFGKIRSYFRYIKNIGLPVIIPRIAFLLFVIIYPIYLSKNIIDISDIGIIYSVLFLTIYVVIRMVSFIPEFFKFYKIELDNISEPSDKDDDNHSNVDIKKEKKILKDYLISNGLEEIKNIERISFLDGELDPQFLEKENKSEAWFNIYINVSNVNNFELRNEVLKYAAKLFGLFKKSQVDINTFVLSFHITIGESGKERNIFFRVKRSELKKMDNLDTNPIDEVQKVENKLFDELFRNLE